MAQNQDFQEDEKTQLEDDIRNSGLALETLNNEVEWMNNKLSYLTSQSAEIKKENAALQELNNEKIEELMVLRFKRDMSEKQFKDETNRHKNTKDDLAELKEKYYLLYDLHERILIDYKELQKNNGPFDLDENDIPGALKNEKVKEYENKIHELKLQINTLEAENEKRKHSLEYEISSHLSTQQYYSATQSKIGELNTTMDKLKEEKKEMEGKYLSQISNLKIERKKLVKENTDFKFKISALENENHAHQNSINKLKSENIEKESEMSSMKIKVGRAFAELQAKDAVIADLEATIEEMNKNYNVIQAVHLELKTKYTEISSNAKYHKMQFHKQSVTLETVEKTCEEQAEQIEKLKKDLINFENETKIIKENIHMEKDTHILEKESRDKKLNELQIESKIQNKELIEKINRHQKQIN
jgi:chromosome segregation ATPase